jgi:hypothetical protein
MANTYATPPPTNMGDEITAALDRLRSRERRDGLVDELAGASRGPRGLQGGSARGTRGGEGGGAVPQSIQTAGYVDSDLPMDGWWTHPDLPRVAGVRRVGGNGAMAKNSPPPTFASDHWFRQMMRGDAFKLYVIFCIIVGVFGALVSNFIGGNAGREAALQAMHVEPAMVLRDLTLIHPQIRQGETLELMYSYDKRAECSPPDGEGEFLFKVYDSSYIHRLNAGWVVDGLKSGVNLGPIITTLPKLPDLTPGHYKLGMRGVFVCQGERDPQIITTQKLPFEVLPNDR